MRKTVKNAFQIASLVMAGVLLTLTACSANTVQIEQTDIPLQPEMVQPELTQSSSGGQLEESTKPEQNVTLYNSSSYTVFSNELMFDSDMKVDYQQKTT